MPDSIGTADTAQNETPWKLVDCAMCGYDFKKQNGGTICEVCLKMQENFPEIFTWVDAVYRYQRVLMERFEQKMDLKLSADRKSTRLNSSH